MTTSSKARDAAVAYLRSHPEDALAVMAEAGVATTPQGGRFRWTVDDEGRGRLELRPPSETERELAETKSELAALKDEWLGNTQQPED